MKQRFFANITGLMLSVLCVIHCILTPIFLASLPGLGLDWLANPGFHRTTALIGLAIGLWTLIPGWRIHQRHSVLVVGFLGLSVMNVSAFQEDSCCAAETETTECELQCCTTSGSQQPVLAATAPNDAASRDIVHETIFAVVSWLWHHPTVFGATLLAWAHCFNGGCQRACCNTKEEAPMELSIS